MFNQWCTIESDPGVFTELINRLGVPSAQVQEVYSMEDDQLITKIKPQIYGFIFLFKWTKNNDSKDPLTMYDEDLFFARQIVNNACATQAILSVLLNAPVQIQGILKDFHEFTKFLPCEDKGLALSNSDEIRKIHNSFSRPQPFIFKEDKKAKKKGDVYHFVSYVPFKNHLYELDGLQGGPIMIGKYENSNEWIELAKAEIQQRILKYSEKEIRFNLLVVCENLKKKKMKQNEKLNQQKASILKKLKSLGKAVDEQFIKNYEMIDEIDNNNEQELNQRLSEISLEIEGNELYCLEEDRKSEERKEENIRRKHNYVPMILQLMKILAKKDKLGELIEKAKQKKGNS